MIREIGSEYWLDKKHDKEYDEKKPSLFWEKLGDDYKLLLSGRTAIDFIIQDIDKKIETAYMPSYTCSSMIKPLIDNGINVDFYDVYYNNETLVFDIDLDRKCDLFFAMNYFGFSQFNMEKEIMNFKDENVIILEDITHSLLSEKIGSKYSDYYVASLRKWFPIPSGGLAIKNNGNFKEVELINSELKIKDRKEAMELKSQYIENIGSKKNINKDTFLKKYGKFNKELKNDYRNYSIDELSKKILLSLDINEIKQKRKDNATYLHDKIASLKGIQPMFSKLNIENDVPLFYPIMYKDRNELKDYFINNNIYAPTHWPVSFLHYLNDKTKNIYEQSLSLICDQRYNVADMKVIINKMGDFIR